MLRSVATDKPERHYHDRGLYFCNKADMMRGSLKETKEWGGGGKNKRQISLEGTTDGLKGNKRVEERCSRKRSGGMSEEVRQSVKKKKKKWKQGHRQTEKKNQKSY